MKRSLTAEREEYNVHITLRVMDDLPLSYIVLRLE
jgi:hypothetical protein